VQALAATGVAVLQVEHAELNDHEGPQIVERIDAAVSALRSSGRLDVGKVGILGHSRQGWEVSYVVTHPGREPIAAAVCIDFGTNTYFDTLRARGTIPMLPATFWQHKQQWLENETSFNVDKVRTPTMMMLFGTAYRPFEELSTVDLIEAFRENRRPLEY